MKWRKYNNNRCKNSRVLALRACTPLDLQARFLIKLSLGKRLTPSATLRLIEEESTSPEQHSFTSRTSSSSVHPFPTQLTLIHAFITSRLQQFYCSPSEILNKLQYIQNSTARLFTHSPTTSPSSSLSSTGSPSPGGSISNSFS